MSHSQSNRRAIAGAGPLLSRHVSAAPSDILGGGESVHLATLAIKLACLDMAGTVINDDGIVMGAFASAMKAVGIEGEALKNALTYTSQTMGKPKATVFADLLGGDRQTPRVEEALATFNLAIAEAISDGRVVEVPGARATMTALRARGVKVCLTTGFTPETQEAMVAYLGWQGLVDLTLAPGRGLRGRPYPDMVLAAVLRLAVDDVREVAVVGDTASDLWSGHRAGAGIVAGVLTGSHGRSQLEEAPHTHILGSVADLPSLIRS